MTKQKQLIAAISMDLKRIALSSHNGSESVASTFCKEAILKISEIDDKDCKPYMQRIIKKLPGILKQKDKKKLAEDALMYSTIFQNYALYV